MKDQTMNRTIDDWSQINDQSHVGSVIQCYPSSNDQAVIWSLGCDSILSNLHLNVRQCSGSISDYAADPSKFESERDRQFPEDCRYLLLMSFN